MTINCNVDSYDERQYKTKAEFELCEEATVYDAMDMFVEALEIDGYQPKSIAHGLYEKFKALCEELEITEEELLEFYDKIDDIIENY